MKSTSNYLDLSSVLNLSTVLNPVNSLPTNQSAEILEFLRSQAGTVLSSALGGVPLVPFATNGSGNFPFYWQNPTNLEFNLNTYNWINKRLMAGAHPSQLENSNFVDEYITALGAITYTLSTRDQALLNEASQKATNQQLALLNNWKAIYGSLPTPVSGETAIDTIVTIICSKWATNPPCTLMQIQNAIDLNELLGNTPASGEPILPILSNWVNALGSSVPLQNAVSMNNGYKNAALRAAQTATEANGGIKISNIFYPSYKVAKSVSAILNELKSSNKVTLKMSVSRYSASEYSVSISGSAGFRVSLGFFSLGIGGSTSYFQDNIANNASSITIEMTYTGVTLVPYCPTAFTKSPLQNWYSIQPILDAIKVGDKDVSGYRFGPNPGIDFSKNGPFGFTQGCAIANYPTIVINIESSDYHKIAQTFTQSASTKVSFLGIPLGGGSESTYSNKVSENASSSQVTITLNPPDNLVLESALDSTAFILGVQTCYPATSLV